MKTAQMCKDIFGSQLMMPEDVERVALEAPSATSGLTPSRDFAVRLLLDPAHSPFTIMPVREMTQTGQGQAGASTAMPFGIEIASSNPSRITCIPTGQSGSVIS